MPRRNKVSSISLNIPAAGLGSRPPSTISSSTTDEGGFNEPCPKIEARLMPHEESLYDYPMTEDKPLEYSDSSPEEEIRVFNKDSSTASTGSGTPQTKLTPQEIEALYAVPHKPHSVHQQKSVISTDSDVSQVTVIAAKPADSDFKASNSSNTDSNSVSMVRSVEYERLYIDEADSDKILQSEEEVELEEKENIQEFDNKTDSGRKSEPFILIREVLPCTNKSSRSPEVQLSEAMILDLNDVEFADASDNEVEEDIKPSDKSVPEADAMTPAEAENLLSTK